MLELIIMILSILVLQNTYNDLKVMKEYCISKKQKKTNQVKNRKETHVVYQPKHFVYPWWHTGFSHGGFRVGPWTWSRQQHYYHPGLGWYASPFPIF
jgi:hypothetical protein